MKSRVPPKQNTQGFSLLIALLIIVLALLAYWTYKAGTFEQFMPIKTQPAATPSLTPSPTPIQLIEGKETYGVSQGTHTGPSITQVIFDPLDVYKGQQLEISVMITDTSPITEVTATLQTDGGTQEFTLVKSDKKDIWTGTIVPDNTLWYTYILTVTAKSAGGTSSATIAPRS